MVFLPLSRERVRQACPFSVSGRMGLDLSDLGWAGNNINKK